MEVYGVWRHDYEDDTLLGLYRSRDEAQRHADAHNSVPEIACLRETDIALYERTRASVEPHTLTDRFLGLQVSRQAA